MAASCRNHSATLQMPPSRFGGPVSAAGTGPLPFSKAVESEVRVKEEGAPLVPPNTTEKLADLFPLGPGSVLRTNGCVSAANQESMHRAGHFFWVPGTPRKREEDQPQGLQEEKAMGRGLRPCLALIPPCAPNVQDPAFPTRILPENGTTVCNLWTSVPGYLRPPTPFVVRRGTSRRGDGPSPVLAATHCAANWWTSSTGDRRSPLRSMQSATLISVLEDVHSHD